MTPDAARSAVLSALAGIAPEIDLDALDPDADLREQADLDSMDVLELVSRLSATTGADVREDDYGSFSTLRGAVAHLVAAAPEPAGS